MRELQAELWLESAVQPGPQAPLWLRSWLPVALAPAAQQGQTLQLSPAVRGRRARGRRHLA